MEYLKIIEDDGKYANTGKFNFSVCAAVCNFTQEEMRDFRSMCVVALRVADNMWIENQTDLPQYTKEAQDDTA